MQDQDLDQARQHLTQSLSYPSVPASPDYADPRLLNAEQTQALLKALDRLFLRPANEAPPRDGADARSGWMLRLGEWWLGQRHFERAGRCFDRLADHADKLRPTAEQEAYALLRAGDCARRLFRPDLAKQYDQRLLSQPRTGKTVYTAAALLSSALLDYGSGGHPNKALAAMREIAEKFPDTPQAVDALFSIGVIYEWSGRKTQAIKAYQAALERYPDHKGLQKAVANSLRTLGVKSPEVPAPSREKGANR